MHIYIYIYIYIYICVWKKQKNTSFHGWLINYNRIPPALGAPRWDARQRYVDHWAPPRRRCGLISNSLACRPPRRGHPAARRTSKTSPRTAAIWRPLTQVEDVKADLGSGSEAFRERCRSASPLFCLLPLNNRLYSRFIIPQCPKRGIRSKPYGDGDCMGSCVALSCVELNETKYIFF